MATPAVSRPTQRNTTPPRPSISPLSTASKDLKSSPIASRDATVQDVDAQLNSEFDNYNAVGAGDLADLGDGHDDRSSSLSDPEDDEEQQNGTIDDAAGEEEELAAHRSLEVDSEAETERLEQTPQKLRRQVDALGRTPSKLSHAATAEEDLSDPPSPLPTGAGAASSTSTIATIGQKRKRSDSAESSLTSAESNLGESPRKRSHGLNTDVLADAEETVEDVEQSTEAAEQVEDPPTLDEERPAPSIPTKGMKGRKGKQKRKRQTDVAEEAEPQPPTEQPTEAEEEPENPAKTEEDLKAKKEASSIYEDVAKQFRAFREKLCNERLATITSELHLLSQPNCMHPEYQRQIACVDARSHKQKSEAHAYYNYRLRSTRDRTLGDRSQLHSQYFQSVRDLREDVLCKLGEDWYAIQKERRQSNQEMDDAYIYKFPTDKKAQIMQQKRYNREVSVLSGMAKYVGFPAAPDISGVDGESFEDDLKAMKISHNRPATHFQPAPVPQQPLPQQAAPRTVFLPGPTTSRFAQNERLAHEQFIEQNPWARPQAPIHHAHGSTPGISHTPDWAEPSAGTHHGPSTRNLIRNLSGQYLNSSPLGTPIPAHRQVLGDAALERISLLYQHQQSPGMAVPKQRQNGAELTGFRNISNLSGASTIDAPLPHDTSSADVIKRNVPVQQVFDTSQLHAGRQHQEVLHAAGFRPQEALGAFGTPAPLSSSAAAGMKFVP
ncbi:Transcriptional regulatory protein [Vermiconidia calcicola]|uniref:Transcriptional regulatory protein n=1 Tax=Vermiconidia calcicola TaxID=1690605 RepID=A0ACC3NKV1_9PEZI|nr:Transcriptional regulatory protein [Vermiconidia calcicola]